MSKQEETVEVVITLTIENKNYYYIQRTMHNKQTLFMASLALMPSGVLAATAALSISPVAKWHKQYSSLMIGDWVPLPDPGGPVIHI